MATLITFGLGGSPFLLIYGLGTGGGVLPPVTNFVMVSAVPIGPLAIRVTFSDVPVAFDPTNAIDATNPANYVLTGSTAASVVAAAPVTGSPTSIDVYLGAPLPAGTWTVTGAPTIQDQVGGNLIDPRGASFQVVVNPPATGVSGGAVNEGLIRRHFNPALKGPGWDDLIFALEGDEDTIVGDGYVSDTARKAYYQLFLASAEGEYLDRRAGEVGVLRPEGVGIGDDAFRALALTMANNLITYRSVHDVLEVFYSSDALRATLVSGRQEPFALQDGDDLELGFGLDREVTVNFRQAQFARVGQAKAVEVAAAIDQAISAAGIHGFAVAFTDPVTGAQRVKIYADSRGTSSAIRALGGRAQVALRLPDDVLPDIVGPYGVWAIASSPDTPGRIRFSSQGGASAYDLSFVREGDLALVYGREFPVVLTGTHEITAVSVTYPGGVLAQWFEIEGVATGLATVAQITADAVAFLRPSLKTIHDQTFQAYAVEGEDGLIVTMPVTTQVVARENGTAGYLAAATGLPVSALDRTGDGVVKVTTSTNHGMAIGDQAFLDDVFAAPALPTVSAGTPSTGLGSSHL